MLTNRIGIFVSLPLAKLSKLSLQKQLDEIGQHTFADLEGVSLVRASTQLASPARR